MLLCGINELWAQYGVPVITFLTTTTVGLSICYGIVYTVKKKLSKFANTNSADMVAESVARKVSNTAIKVIVEPVMEAQMNKLSLKLDSKLDKIIADNILLREDNARIKKAISYSKLIPAEEKAALLNGDKVNDSAPIEVDINDLIISTPEVETVGEEQEKVSMFS